MGKQGSEGDMLGQIYAIATIDQWDRERGVPNGILQYIEERAPLGRVEKYVGSTFVRRSISAK